MSIFNNQENKPKPSKAERAANRVLRGMTSSADQLISNFHSTFDAIWSHENPQEVLDQLGTDGKEVFEVCTATVEYLNVVLVDKRQEDLDKINEKMLSIPAYTVEGDGSITLD